MDYYGTLGPSCADRAVLRRMFEAGMTGLRLNLSHCALASCEEWLASLREAAQDAGVHPELLIDLEGPELRVGAFDEPLVLTEGMSLPAGRLRLPAVVEEALLPGKRLLLDDGKILLEVRQENEAEGGTAGEAAGKEEAQLRVLRGGLLRSRKSVAVEGMSFPLPALTDADRANLREASRFGVTGVMLPFVRSERDLLELREALREAGADGVRIFCKIESLEGVARVVTLLPYADELVIARGDLGNCVNLWELPALQKELAGICRRAGKPFLVVTQMLASMEHAAVPTRAEVADIFNAVLDGASSVMVTGETAVGEYPVQTMEYLVRTGREAEKYRQRMRTEGSETEFSENNI